MIFSKKLLLFYGSIIGIATVFAIGWLSGSHSQNNKVINDIPKQDVSTQNNAQLEDIEYGEILNKDELPDYLKNDINFQLFWEVWSKIQNKFIDKPVGETKLLYGSLKGLVASLEDPYSVFLEPQIAENFTEDLKGRFEGIGAEIGIRDNRLTIIAPLPESPAESAGIMGGDKILSIDEFDTDGIRLDQAVNKIRGEKGTNVVLTIFREGEDKLLDITITRDTIKIVSANIDFKETTSNKKIGIIRITNFNEDTGNRFRKAVNKGLSEGAEGFIIDVRNNPGGFLDKAVEISGYWVPKGEVVVFESFANGDTSSYTSNGSGELKDFPTIILINGGSASASEILAGALQDYEFATLIGETSFGKGSVQELEEFGDGSAIKLTIARWLTPLGRQIDENGIIPEEVIERTVENINEGKDPQVQRALEIMDNKLNNIN